MANTNNSCLDVEHHKLLKILNFRLPHQFKMIGLLVAVLILFFLIGSKFMGDLSLISKDVLRTLILFFLLLASLSKDLEEDEYSNHIRFQSFKLAFVLAATYSIAIPLIAIVFDLIITMITGDGNVNFHQISAFEVLFILLATQLLFFETLKRFGRA